MGKTEFIGWFCKCKKKVFVSASRTCQT